MRFLHSELHTGRSSTIQHFQRKTQLGVSGLHICMFHTLWFTYELIFQCWNSDHRCDFAPCEYYWYVLLCENWSELLDLVLRISRSQLVCRPWTYSLATKLTYELYRYERLAWIPIFIVYIIVVGVGSKHFSNPPPATPATASTILSFASTIAGFVITYSPLASDFTIYYDSSVPRYDVSVLSERWTTMLMFSAAGKCSCIRISVSTFL